MTVTTSASTPVGTYPVSITGTSGALVHNTTVTLVVSQPDFSLTATPASQTVTSGAGTSYAVSVTPAAGFTGSVSLSASGLPAGATASFSPDPTAGTSTMTVTTSATTPGGSYPVTITGTGGGLTHTTAVQLVVQAPVPDFTLSATPSSRSITRGGNTTYTITVSPGNGFAGSVSLSVAGPNPATSSSTLAVTTQRNVTRRSYTLTITGNSGALTHTATVTLVVN
jgi:uncharacterized membrane protein